MKDEDCDKLSNESKAKYKQDMEKNKLRVKKNPRDPYKKGRMPSPSIIVTSNFPG